MNYWTGFKQVDESAEPADDDLHLSQTTVSNAALCPARVGYRGDEGYSYVPSEAMSFGTMVHGMAEEDLGLLGTPMRWAAGSWTFYAVEEMWRDGLLNERDGSFDLYELADRERINKSIMEALHANKRWHEVVAPTLDLAGRDDWQIEKRVTKQLGTLPDGRRVWFGGTADLVVPGLALDWKTAGRGWDQSKADTTYQATYYTWLYGVDRHKYWVWNRREKDWSAFETSRSPKDVESALKVAWMLARQMADGTFTATPWQDTFGKVKRGWWCSAKYCGAWDICQFKNLPDDVYEGQKIDPKVGWE